MVILSFLRNLHRVFNSGFANLHSYQQCRGVPFPSQPLKHLLFIEFLMIAILTSMRWDLTELLICISLIISEVEHLFMGLLAICHVFFREMSIKVFCPLFDWVLLLLLLLLLSCMSCLYILEIKPLFVTSFASIFSHSIGCLFIVVVVVVYGFLC